MAGLCAARVLSERFQGTFAERLAVPRANLIPKPATLSFEAASCLPTAWLTAYTMLFRRAELTPGETVLVQGAGGGLASALIALGSKAGLTVWVTTRRPERGDRARRLGAAAVFGSGEKLPRRVDAVMDSVGAATLQHSLNALTRGGTVVVAGGTSGYRTTIDVATIFSKQVRVLGAAMGTLEDMRRLVTFCDEHQISPEVDDFIDLREAASGIAKLAAGDAEGTVVLRVSS